MFIKWIAKILVAINANTKPSQLATAISIALLLSLISVNGLNLLWVVIFIISFLININLSIEFAFIFIFAPLAFVLQGLQHMIGQAVLAPGPVYELLTMLYTLPLFCFTRLNNTVVMGGLIIGIILFVPLYLFSSFLLKIYRTKVRERIAKSKFVQRFKKLPIIAQLSKLFSKAYGFYSGIK